jgi:glycosyltransferase involved in cell wall biosynthesis
MACGVPVIVSSRGSLPEVAGAAASPIDPDDADGFASAMQRLLDPAAAAAAADRGRAQASRYSWEACAEAALGAYANAVEVHARRH